MGNLKNLDKIVTEIEKELDEKEKFRELAIRSARSIIKLSGGAIRKMQRGGQAQSILEKAKGDALKLRRLLKKHPELSYTGYVENALQELAEGYIVLSIIKKRPLPLPSTIGVTNVAYIMGMGDAVGELRRFALLALTKGQVKKANEYLRLMEELFAALMTFDYPHAIVAVKRKQDVARGLIEKTRGEIVVSSRSKDLEEKLDKLQKKLK
ncbi:MAG: translin family protein [Thermoplasmata archaeon]|nr:translin family protein [Thermoplasmata archaeon]